MKAAIKRLGVIPMFLLGLGFLIIGIMSLNYIFNHWWPIDVTRLDLVRAVALDRVEAASLMEATNREVIGAFLGAVLLSITGLILPLVFILNKRLQENRSPSFWAVLRQSVWGGLWGAFCVWLQMNRTLGIAVAGLVAAVLFIFELLIQVRLQTVQVKQG